jgi:hypothetical protein
MSQTILFGVSEGSLTPRHDLLITRQADGMTTARMSFHCRKFDLETTAVLSKLKKGNSILILYPELGTRWAFLRVDDWASQDEAGGFSIVNVAFRGADNSTGDFSFDSSIVYSRNNAVTEDSIFNNPNFIAQVDPYTRETIRLGSQGVCVRVSEDGYDIRYAANDKDRDELTDEKHIFWWDFIVGKGNLTYLRATSEWTKSATGRGTLKSSDFTKFGYIDNPDGDPGTPSGETWLYTGATEQISIVGDGANSYSKTWLLGKWDPEVYSKASE